MQLVLTTGTEVRGELLFLPFFIGIKGKSHRSPDRSSFGQQSHGTSIHILDDDTLFRVFSYCQLSAFDDREFDVLPSGVCGRVGVGGISS